MGVSCALKAFAFVCAFAWIRSCRGVDSIDDILVKRHVQRIGSASFSSKDIPISISKRDVITEKWFRYIIELVSKFGNRNSMSEVFLYLHQNVKRAFNWCKPNMTPNYILNFTIAGDANYSDKYDHIPCGKVVFSKLSTDKPKEHVYFIVLANGKQTTPLEDTYTSVTFGLNLTIHSFISSEHNQYLSGDFIERMCNYVVLGIFYTYRSSRFKTTKRYYWCGEILGKNMIFQQGMVGIVTGSRNPMDSFQLIIHYQALNLEYHIYADSPIDIYSYNSSSTFYPNSWYFEVPKMVLVAVLVSLERWHFKAIIGQNIKLIVYQTSRCRDELEAISIYDGPVKVYDQLVCTVNKEPKSQTEQREQTEPTEQREQTEPTEQREQRERTEQTEQREQTERSTQTKQTNPTVPLISYTSTFNSQINYCLNIAQHSHIFFTFEVQTMASTRIHVEHDQKYQLQVASGTNTIYYRSWQFTSDSFIKLELAALRKFRGHTYECLYGGMVLNDIGNPLELQYGSICTTYQGYEPLFSTPYWYFNRHGAMLTVYAFYNYFTIDIDLILTSQPCEGVTNICSRLCR